MQICASAVWTRVPENAWSTRTALIVRCCSAVVCGHYVQHVSPNLLRTTLCTLVCRVPPPRERSADSEVMLEQPSCWLVMNTSWRRHCESNMRHFEWCSLLDGRHQWSPLRPNGLARWLSANSVLGFLLFCSSCFTHGIKMRTPFITCIGILLLSISLTMTPPILWNWTRWPSSAVEDTASRIVCTDVTALVGVLTRFFSAIPSMVVSPSCATGSPLAVLKHHAWTTCCMLLHWDLTAHLPQQHTA